MAKASWKNTAAFTFIWTIENYRQPPYLKLLSPSFTVDSIDKTKWRLVLHVNQQCVLCYIKRQIDRSTLKSMGLHFELVVVAADGTPAIEQKVAIFYINPHSNIVKLIENSVLNERKKEFLPNNTLTVRCQIWRRDVCFSEADLCFAITQLRNEQLSFIWAVEKLSSLLPGQRRNHSLQTTINCGLTMTLSIYLDQNDMFHLEIIALGARYCGLKVKISAMDMVGKIVHSVAVACQLHLNEQTISFPPFIGKKELKKCDKTHKEKCLLNDVLLLKCEFDIFAGTIWSGIEYCLQSNCMDADGRATAENNYLKDNIFISSNADSFFKRSLVLCGYAMEKQENAYFKGEHSVSSTTDCSPKKNLNAKGNAMSEDEYKGENYDECKEYCFLKKTLKYVQEESVFSDVILRSGNQLYPAHRNILTVRSPVFEKMFSCGMLDQDSGVVDLRNLDGNILRYILLYLYTDTLKELGWQDVIDLFYAADLYELTDLMRKCSVFLKSSLSNSNVFDVLSFANERQVGNLITAAKDFIIQHETELSSTEIEKVYKISRKRINKGNN